MANLAKDHEWWLDYSEVHVKTFLCVISVLWVFASNRRLIAVAHSINTMTKSSPFFYAIRDWSFNTWLKHMRCFSFVKCPQTLPFLSGQADVGWGGVCKWCLMQESRRVSGLSCGLCRWDGLTWWEHCHVQTETKTWDRSRTWLSSDSINLLTPLAFTRALSTAAPQMGAAPSGSGGGREFWSLVLKEDAGAFCHFSRSLINHLCLSSPVMLAP